MAFVMHLRTSVMRYKRPRYQSAVASRNVAGPLALGFGFVLPFLLLGLLAVNGVDIGSLAQINAGAKAQHQSQKLHHTCELCPF